MIFYYPISRTIALLIGDAIIFTWAFYTAYLIRRTGDYVPFFPLPVREPYIEHVYGYLLASLFIFLCSMTYFGVYGTRIASAQRRLARFFNGWFFSGVLSLVFAYLFHDFIIGGEIPRLIYFYTWVMVLGASGMIHFFVDLFYERRRKNNPSPQHLHLKWWVMILSAWGGNDRVFRNPKLLMAYLREDTSVVYRLSVEPDVDYNPWVAALEISGVKYLLDMSSVLPQIYRGNMTEIGGERYLGFVPVKMSPIDVLIKRSIDLLGASLGLILLLPVFVLIAILIKIEDPAGPIVYKNIRVGRHGKTFSLYKFRYMYWRYCIKDGYGVENQNDDALKYEETLKKQLDTRQDALYKIKNDPRKMRIGRYIEKYSLDELPQLWNVLLGNMSLVWPRPHQPREVEKYEEWYERVLVVSPGITGMAQTHGRHKNTLEQEVSLDLEYIDRWSIPLDCYILFRTIFVVLSGKKE